MEKLAKPESVDWQIHNDRNSHISQKEALLEFKSLLLANTSATAADSLLEWDPDTSCCGWSDVGCWSEVEPRVVTDLDFSYLVPSILGENATVTSAILAPLFRLTTLMRLDLTTNYIHGEIPPEISNLTRLEDLDLSSNHFSGAIPPQLFSLTNLQTLRLSVCEVEKTGSYIDGPFVRRSYKNGNFLTGEIPGEIGNLTKLQELDLGNNRLTGAIPQALLGLEKLESLSLRGNFLSGEIPVGIGNVSRLDSISLSDNRLTGGIPLSIQNLTKLYTLTLDDNLLSGGIPIGLFDFPEMAALYLGNNNLTLKNVDALVPKSKLGELSLASCSISGRIPVWLRNQTEISYLDLSRNRINGGFPKWLAKMGIIDLVVSDNLLEGTLPLELFLERGLEGPSQGILDLSKNKFSGNFPDSDRCDRDWFMALVLSNNQFTGPITQCISNVSTLALLDLSMNQLSGEPFQSLCRHPSSSCPSYIDISFNSFHGEISVAYVSNRYQLGVLELSHNEFTGISPRNLETLKFLDLNNNNISGEIPTSLSTMSSLQILVLRNNYLEGSIPLQAFSNLTSLRILDLSGNRVSGTVPASLGDLAGMRIAPSDSSIKEMVSHSSGYFSYFDREMLTSFTPLLEVFWKTLHLGLPNEHLGLYTFLDLSNNRLSGEIPRTLGRLTSLKVLNLSHNQLTGRIPASFGEMRDLESLDLSHNDLDGEIPESMGKLLQLTNLKLSDNNLTGRIPHGPQMDRMNDPDSYARNVGGLCGTQIRVPCIEPVTPEEAASTPGDGIESEEGLVWFSWMTAGIGYPAGFVTTVLGIGHTWHNDQYFLVFE
ncbi:unnamed protein product [Linum tenue]|uniref:Leucine-rich repeat-containing N-terminal plant-type domain-containing protein n=1 Tax=Linum tenue TaxID=586396 RepID=A0AAV0ILM0_9ROSI|nr:unnamed protein product [Linum tenue]